MVYSFILVKKDGTTVKYLKNAEKRSFGREKTSRQFFFDKNEAKELKKQLALEYPNYDVILLESYGKTSPYENKDPIIIFPSGFDSKPKKRKK